MLNVIFVAPYFMPATVRFIEAVAELPNTRTGLISQDPVQMLPQGLRHQLAAHYKVNDGMNEGELLNAAKSLIGQLGPCHRLFGALEDLQVPLARVREALGVKGMSVRAANNFRDKSTMKNVLRQAGIPCAKHCLTRSVEEARAFIRSVGYPVVAKPPAGAGSRNTSRLSNQAEADAYFAGMASQMGTPTLFEEFVRGVEHSFDSIWIRGRMVWHSITRYYPTPLEVLENPWIQWCILMPREVDHPHFNDIRTAAEKAQQALGMETGLNHLEWFRREDNSLAISETAARPPGAQITTLHSVGHDIDLFKAWAKLMVFETFDIPERKYAAGVAFLRGQGEGRVKAVHGLDQAQKEIGPLVIEARLPQQGQAARQGYEGQGYVIVRHPETSIVKKALHRLVSLIRVELA